MGTTKVIYHPEAEADLRRRLGIGLLNAMFAVEGASKALTPVHGDPSAGGQFATFAPNVPPRGGTLRRSQHAVVFVDGKAIPGSDTQDENGAAVPTYPASESIVGYVGTNVDYAAYVHNGTVKMRARPFLLTALVNTQSQLTSLVLAGFRKASGR